MLSLRQYNEAEVLIKLGDLTEAADRLEAAAAAAASGADASKDDEALRARCLLASAAQQYLQPEAAAHQRDLDWDGEGEAPEEVDVDLVEVASLLGAARAAFRRLQDVEGEARYGGAG